MHQGVLGDQSPVRGEKESQRKSVSSPPDITDILDHMGTKTEVMQIQYLKCFKNVLVAYTDLRVLCQVQWNAYVISSYREI